MYSSAYTKNTYKIKTWPILQEITYSFISSLENPGILPPIFR